MDLTINVNKFKQLLKDKYPEYNALKYENLTASAQDIQQILQKDEALIEYFVTKDVLYAFFVNKNKVKLYKLDISKSVLQNKISSLRNGLTNYNLINSNPEKAFKTYVKPAYWFYSNIVSPLLAEAEGIKHLIIVTDGELGNLPFEAFITEQANQKINYNTLKYLLDDFSISYNYSATLLKTNSELAQRKHNGKLLAIAPTYNNDSTTTLIRRPIHLKKLRQSLSPIPQATEEIKGLEDLFDGTFEYDLQANEASFKEKAEDYAVIHLAMHGLLNSYSPILSSLAFTENGDSLEDNFLHAHEISKLNLNADLIVLSACETGYGKFEQGEGILSLARSFMYAGSSSLIVSLWQVNDYTTSKIMKNLYDNLANGLEKDEALRQAKLDYMNVAQGFSAHPVFWSPFVMIGNTQPLRLKTKNNLWAWGMGTGVLVFIGLFIWRRKKAA